MRCICAITCIQHWLLMNHQTSGTWFLCRRWRMLCLSGYHWRRLSCQFCWWLWGWRCRWWWRIVKGLDVWSSYTLWLWLVARLGSLSRYTLSSRFLSRHLVVLWHSWVGNAWGFRLVAGLGSLSRYTLSSGFLSRHPLVLVSSGFLHWLLHMMWVANALSSWVVYEVRGWSGNLLSGGLLRKHVRGLWHGWVGNGRGAWLVTRLRNRRWHMRGYMRVMSSPPHGLWCLGGQQCSG